MDSIMPGRPSALQKNREISDMTADFQQISETALSISPYSPIYA